MDNTGKAITTVIVIAVVISAVLLLKKYTTIFGGSNPTQSDKDCASGGGSSKIVGSCTKPKLYPVLKPIKEKCFTSEQLGLSEGDSGPNKVTELGGFGTEWFFNYQSGDRFCYVNKQI